MSWLSRPASETQVTHGQRLWLYIFSGLIMIWLVVPTLIVIPMSFSDSQYLEFPPESGRRAGMRTISGRTRGCRRP